MGVLWLPQNQKPMPGQLVDWNTWGMPNPVFDAQFNDGPGSPIVTNYSDLANPGVLTSMDPPTDWVPTPYGWGLDFDGSNDCISCPSRPLYDFAAGFSIMARILWSNFPADGCAWINRGSWTSDGFYCVNYQSGGDPTTGNLNLTTNKAGVYTTFYTNDASLVSNRWYDIAIVHQGAGLHGLPYIDGILAGKKTSEALVQPTANSRSLIIGSYTIGGSMPFPGKINRLCLFADALASSQVLAHQGPVPIWSPQRYWWVTAGGAQTVELSDALGFADALSLSQAYKQTLTDALALADVPTIRAAYSVPLADAGAFADVLSPVHGYLATLADAAGLADAFSVTQAYLAALSEALAFSRTLSLSAAYVVSVADGFGFADVLAGPVAAYNVRLGTEAWRFAGAGDGTYNQVFWKTGTHNSYPYYAATNPVRYLYSYADWQQWILSTALDGPVAYIAGDIGPLGAYSWSEVGGTAPAPTLAQAGSDEAISFADVHTGRAAYNVALADATALADVLQPLAAYRMILADNLAAADAYTGAQAYVVTLADGVGFADLLSTLANYRVSLAEALGLADTLTAVGGESPYIVFVVRADDAVYVVPAVDALRIVRADDAIYPVNVAGN